MPRFISELCDQYVEENGTLTLQVDVAGASLRQEGTFGDEAPIPFFFYKVEDNGLMMSVLISMGTVDRYYSVLFFFVNEKILTSLSSIVSKCYSFRFSGILG